MTETRVMTEEPARGDRAQRLLSGAGDRRRRQRPRTGAGHRVLRAP